MIRLAAAFLLTATPAYSEEDVNCLAMNIYHESRGEDVIGQVAVAHVTLNRMNHEYFPDSICDVVYEHRQFSWTQDGLSDYPHDHQSWIESIDIAMLVLNNEVEDPTNGALFYHANWVNPSWARHHNIEMALEHGVHVFYHWNGSWN
jgi:spore germination cell wall hydrolase CwlJ-like protein